ncbi:MAG TPA: hypothetical protein DHU78_07325 [Opitutae bacterium]|nr:hypothetical protein [Opitutae bacterium]
MKRFAFVTTNLTIGGAQTWLANLSEMLIKKGHEVHVILFSSKIDIELDRDVEVHFLSSEKSFLGVRSKKILASFWLTYLFRRFGPFDLTISTLPFADQITSRAKIGNVYYRIANTLSQEITDLGISKGKRRHKRYARLYHDKNVISVSNGVKEDLVENFNLKIKDITTIYNPIDQKKIIRLSNSYLPKYNEPYIIHSGRFSPQKRHDVLLDAFVCYLSKTDDNNPKKLILLSEKSDKLDAMIKDRGLSKFVLNIGFQSNPFPWYRHASCLVLSSDREGMPNVLLESLTLGTPVASTDCPSGPSELLRNHYPKSLCPVGQPVALANSITEALRSDFSDAADLILKPFQPSSVIKRILNLC